MNSRNSPEYLTFWQKADTKVIEEALRKLNRLWSFQFSENSRIYFIKDHPYLKTTNTGSAWTEISIRSQ